MKTRYEYTLQVSAGRLRALLDPFRDAPDGTVLEFLAADTLTVREVKPIEIIDAKGRL